MENLRELQLIQLEMLKEIDRVCSKYDIKYTLSCGTALGAIRHGGFIPWDDDLDIAMLRDDYEKFLHHAQNEMKSHFFLQTFETDREYPLCFAKIRNSNTTMVEIQTSELNINKGVYIDIFPIDNVTSNGLLRTIFKYLLSAISVIKFSTTVEYCERSKSSIVRKIRLGVMPICKFIGTYRLCKVENWLITLFRKSNSKLTFAESNQGVPPHRVSDEKLLNLNIFQDTVLIEFEGYKFPIVEKYKEYLSTLYGNYNELPPICDRYPHHDVIELNLHKPFVEK